MEDNKENAPAAEPVAAQPEASGTPPAKSAAETKLEGQLTAAKTKGDGYKKERDTLTKERDELRLENGQLKADNERLTREVADAKTPAAAANKPEATVAAEAPSEEEYIKDLLRRNGLKVAYMLPTGPCFSEQHARQYAGEEFDTLTTITAE